MIAVDQDDFTFYYGCASGSARKALRKMEEPNVMLSFATANNTPFETIENLFVDSGGYSQLQTHEEYQASDAAYLDYIEQHEPAKFVLRDYPCDPVLRQQLGQTVQEQQQRTTNHHRELLDTWEERGQPSEPVAVVQGWNPEQYLDHLDDLRSEGALTRHVAIGSLCGRQDTATVTRGIRELREALPGKHQLHAFGVKSSILQIPRVIGAIDSADSMAYDFRTRMHESRNTWQNQVYYYLQMKQRIKDCTSKKDVQRSLVPYSF